MDFESGSSSASGSGSGLFSTTGAPDNLFMCRDDMFDNLTGFCRNSAVVLSTTNITAPATTWTVLYTVQKYAPYAAAIQALYFIIAFFWNLFILLSFAMRRKLLKEPAGVYLFNLALTDFLLAIFVVFQCFLTEAAGGFIIGSTDVIRCGICEFLGFMLMFLMTCTLHTLAMLSFDRFFLLIKPLSYQQYFNWKKALVIVIIIWIFSFIMAIPPIFGFGEYSYSTPISNCHPVWVGKSYRGIDNFNYIIFLSVEAVLPIIFLTFTNIWTYKIITSVLRSKLKRQRSFSAGSKSAKTPEMKTSQSTHNRQQLQLVKVFGALFIAHIMCWTPVLIAVAVGLVIGPCNLPPEVLLANWMLYLTNSVAHPVLETFFIKDLRSRVYRAQRSVRNSLKRVSSMGSSFRRSWSKRYDSRRSKRAAKKSSVLSQNSASVAMEVGSPLSCDVTSLPECDNILLKLSDVKFSVIEEELEREEEREEQLQRFSEISCPDGDIGIDSTDRSYLTPYPLESVGARRGGKQNNNASFLSQRENSLENGGLNTSKLSVTTV